MVVAHERRLLLDTGPSAGAPAAAFPPPAAAGAGADRRCRQAALALALGTVVGACSAAATTRGAGMRRAGPTHAVAAAPDGGRAAPGAPTPASVRAAHRSAPAPRTLALYGFDAVGSLEGVCDGAGYRQFDFWVGDWRVSGVAPDGATLTFRDVPSRITREVGGCAVAENFDGQGRSLNSYDPATRTYHQMWVPVHRRQAPVAGQTHLVGHRLPDGAMRMTGTREVPCATCPGGRFRLRDVWVWTPITRDSVRQLHQAHHPLNDSVVARFDGRYRRVPSAPPSPSPATSPCTTESPFRALDFLLGAWVLTPSDDAAPGDRSARVVVTGDVGGCLLEERVAGPDDYEGWSFTGFSVFDDHWHRTHVDNRGARTFLRGTVRDGAAVLTGTHARADGTHTAVRMTWRLEADGRVTERWEVSHDGGATYVSDRRLIRARRP